VHSLHLLNALLAELLRILSDSGLLSNSQQSSFLCALLYTRSMPTWQSSTESSSDSVCNCVLTYTALPPEVFSNLTGLLPELMTSVLCLSTSLSDSSEFRSASSVHGSQNPQRSVTPSWCEASKTFNLKSNTTPANAST
jgi:hypothetical protein